MLREHKHVVRLWRVVADPTSEPNAYATVLSSSCETIVVKKSLWLVLH